MLNDPEHFQTHGYVKIPAILNPELCSLIANYVRLKAKTKPRIRRGSDPLRDVHREYGDPLMETLLDQLKPSVEAATGLTLHPTLSFIYHYSNGNLLQPHKDRESCEVVAGLCIDADDKFKTRQNDWPLILKDRQHITLNYGDMLVFKGHEIEHWRELFTGDWFVSAILGYVDAQGPYAYQKFDQRKALGLPHVGMTAWTWGKFKANLNKFFRSK